MSNISFTHKFLKQYFYFKIPSILRGGIVEFIIKSVKSTSSPSHLS